MFRHLLKGYLATRAFTDTSGHTVAQTGSSAAKAVHGSSGTEPPVSLLAPSAISTSPTDTPAGQQSHPIPGVDVSSSGILLVSVLTPSRRARRLKGYLAPRRL